VAEVSNFVHLPAAAVRERWEARAIRMATLFSTDIAAGAKPRDKTGMCVLSIIAHRLSIEDLQFALRVCGFRGTTTPMLSSAAKIAKTGHVMANMVASDRHEYVNQALFRDTRQMETAMRNFADLLRLTDAERVEFFEAVKAWVVCDYRIDPNMDPTDPDAKRLTVN
jgi:hypothetical protein